MGETRQLYFVYDGDAQNGETVVDMRGEEHIPARGDLIQRRGRTWKVVQVSREDSMTPGGPVPIYRIFLTSDLKLPI